jgi:hypothetical protein
VWRWKQISIRRIAYLAAALRTEMHDDRNHIIAPIMIIIIGNPPTTSFRGAHAVGDLKRRGPSAAQLLHDARNNAGLGGVTAASIKPPEIDALCDILARKLL